MGLFGSSAPLPHKSTYISINRLTLTESISGGAPDDVRGYKIADQNTDAFHKTRIHHKTYLGQNED